MTLFSLNLVDDANSTIILQGRSVIGSKLNGQHRRKHVEWVNAIVLRIDVAAAVLRRG